MKKFNLVYKSFGEAAILIEWPQVINEEILNDIRLFSEAIKSNDITGIIDFNFVYCSMVITFNNEVITHDKLTELLKEIYSTNDFSSTSDDKTWYIPVCYDECFGLDILELLSIKGMDLEELIALHTSTYYTVYGIGFLPGFLYLGGLHKKLAIPRKENPRVHVPEKSVAIGGLQTGIYPQESPGGWYIVGKTPIPLFNAKDDIPCFITVGDKVKFYAVSKSEFDILEIEVQAEIYDFKSMKHD